MSFVLETARRTLGFEAEPGELAGYVRPMPDGSTRLDWDLSVGAATRRLPLSPDDPDDYEFDPRAYHQALVLPFRRLDDFDGRPIALDAADTRWEDPNGTLYLFSHETVLRATLRLSRLSTDRFRVRWEGEARTMLDADAGDAPTRFSIDAEARLRAVFVAGREGEDFGAFWTRLAAHLDPDDFVAPAGVEPIGSPDGGLDDDGSGRAPARVVFVPRPAGRTRMPTAPAGGDAG